ncbi:MAG: hypothetical protein JSS77_05165 [Acidobacteria bacterium]|nr:hypothetical protein [Acidobacteriota bacterium]
MKDLTADQIQELYDKYLELIHREVDEFGVEPTEVRHLIGRLGEFYCALQTGGQLAHTVNQHGFDVICGDGKRISVKTTAQIAGFVAISETTADNVNDLMVVQYRDGKLSTIYYGPLRPAIEAARYYEPDKNYELDISKARRLTAKYGLKQA